MTLTPEKLSAVADPIDGQPQFFTIAQLAISPLNVRLNEVAIEKVEVLRAQILADGLLQPLVIHPAPPRANWARPSANSGAPGQKEPARFGVFAGGRRWRAIRGAIEAGQLPADFAIAATVRDLPDGDIILLSLIENIGREELLLVETCRAVTRAAAEGLTVEQIAARTGQRRRWVEQQLRLGELAPEVFAAFVAGKLSTEQAMAYAATGDHALQSQAWLHFTSSLAHRHDPAAIRAFFKVGDRELARNLLFVGEAIYRGNGGRFELDLFADGPDSMRGRVTDEALLARLVTEKMEVVRGMVRSAWGERELRFQAAPPQQPNLKIADRELEVRGKKLDWESIRIPRGADPADFVATIEIEGGGDWLPRLWWKSRAAKGAFGKISSATTGEPAREESDAARTLRSGGAEGGALERHSSYEAEARRIVRDGHGLTADGVEVVRTIRRDLLRFALLCSPEREVAGDYLTWSALRQELTRDSVTRTGARGLTGEGYAIGDREPGELMRDQREGQEAQILWEASLTGMRGHPAFALPDAAAALEAYLSAEPRVKRTAEALLAGLSLIRSMASPGWDVAAHTVLAGALGFDPGGLRQGWQPTSAFTGLFGKMARQEMVAPFVAEAQRRQLAKAKDRELSDRTAEILAAQEAWLHPLLAFGGAAARSSAPPEVAAANAAEPVPGPVA